MEDTRRNSYEGFVAAIEIFARHEKHGMETKFIFGAEHDIIYSHLSIGEETDVEAEQLAALGWHEDSEADVWAYFT